MSASERSTVAGVCCDASRHANRVRDHMMLAANAMTTSPQVASSAAAAIAVSPDARRGVQDQNARAPAPRRMGNDMGWFVFEALVAAGVLLFMVWWTMFSGRRRDEHRGDDDPPDPPAAG